MGAGPYWYVVPYEDPKAALRKLRTREFKAGRYYPAVDQPKFPVNEKAPSAGPKHKTIALALEAAEETGTRSILDIERIADTPEFLTATPLSDEDLVKFFKTTRPTRKAVLDDPLTRHLFFGSIKRGHAVIVTLYENDTAANLLFAGYSFD